MASKTYNNFHLGLAQDNHKTGGKAFIDSKNLDGLNTGYGVTLGPKPNKLFYTTSPMRGLYFTPLTSTVLNERHVTFGDNGEVYVLGLASDDTPTYTFPGSVRGAFNANTYYYFLYTDATSSISINLARCLTIDVFNGTFASIDLNFSLFFIDHYDNPPIVEVDNVFYIGGLGKVKHIANNVIGTDFTSVDRYVTGITKHLTQFMLYTSENRVYYVSEGAMLTAGDNSGSNILDFQPRRVGQTANFDYILTREGELQVGSGTNTQQLSKKFISNRLEDNSAYKTVFNFDLGTDVAGDMITFVNDRVYIVNGGDKPGIMVYGKLIPGVNNSFHNIINTNSDGEDFTAVYAVGYEHTTDRIYYTYSTATKNGIDYIDVNSKETNDTGYGITEIFSANTAFLKQPNAIRLTADNTNGDNYVKLYVRINNGSWELIKDINEASAIVDRYEANNKVKKEYIDIQFKIELHNDSKGENPPLMQELYHDYTVIPK